MWHPCSGAPLIGDTVIPLSKTKGEGYENCKSYNSNNLYKCGNSWL